MVTQRWVQYQRPSSARLMLEAETSTIAAKSGRDSRVIVIRLVRET